MQTTTEETGFVEAAHKGTMLLGDEIESTDWADEHRKAQESGEVFEGTEVSKQ